MSRLTISNKAMLTIAALVIPTEFLIMTAYSKTQHTSGYIVGDISGAVRALALLGILSSAFLLATLLLGLKNEPKKKGSGALACVLVLVIVLIQAIYFTS